jgi:imidazolonepropionase
MLLEVTRERPAVLPADRATLLIEHASELVTLGWSFGDGARGGLWQGDPGLIHDGAVAIGGDGLVLAAGPTERVREIIDLSPKARVYNASGCAIVPGFIDAYAEAIVSGAEESAPGGSSSRHRRVRPAADPVSAALSLSERDLVATIWRRLDALLLSGTTGAVLTSGYVLDPDDEMSLLRAVQAIIEVGPLTVVGAFRAAGITPGENRISADEYVALLAHELLPDIAEDELATLFTLAADHTALSLEQSWRVLRAAQTHGLRRRLELSATSHPGVVDFAEEMGVGSIVLLDAPSEDDLARLAESQLTVVLSVGADGVATWGRQCARRLIELGIPLALGTGSGPMGGAPSTMLDALRFACNGLGLTPAEALIAATVNAAFASGMSDDVGPLEPGKRADLLILNTPSYSRLPYEISDDPIRAVVKDGWLVVDQGARVA